MKATGNSLIWVIVAVLALGGMVAVQQGWINLGLGSSALPGWTTLSLDTVDFDSNNPLFNGPAWVLTVVQGGLGQTAQLYASPSQLDSQKGLDLLIEYSEQTCNYEIVPLDDGINVYHNIYTAELEEWSCFGNPSTIDIQSRCPNYVRAGKYSDKNVCFCIETTQQTSVVSTPTQIQSPWVRTIADISVNNGGSVDTFQMDTDASFSGWINDDVFVSWVGYVGSGKPCLSKSGIFAYNKYVNGEFRWFTGNYQKYLDYKTNINALIYLSSSPDSGVINGYMGGINQNANDAMNSVIWGFNGHIQDRTSLNNAIIVNEVDGFIDFPLYTFKINGDYLIRIHQPTSDISIGQVTCGDFQTNGEIYAIVNNIGTESVNVNSWVDCNQFSQTSGNGIKSIGVGNSKTWTIGISAAVTVDTTDNCVFHAQTADASVHRTKPVTCTAEPHQMGCDEGEQRCSFDKIQECNDVGAWVDKTDCTANDQICQYDIYTAIPECVNEDDPVPPPDNDCSVCPTVCGVGDIFCGINCWFWQTIQCPLENFLTWLWTQIVNGFAMFGVIALALGGLYLLMDRRK